MRLFKLEIKDFFFFQEATKKYTLFIVSNCKKMDHNKLYKKSKQEKINEIFYYLHFD